MHLIAACLIIYIPIAVYSHYVPLKQIQKYYRPAVQTYETTAHKRSYPVQACVTPHNDKGICQPLHVCASYYLGFNNYEAMQYGACNHGYSPKLYCCPEVLVSKAKGVSVIPEQMKTKGDIHMSESELYDALKHAHAAMKHRVTYEEDLRSEGYLMGQESLYWAVSRLTTHYNPIYKRTIPAMALLEATNYIKRRYGLSVDDVIWKLHNKIPTPVALNCTESVTCYESKYRTYDGSCNNRKKPTWGMIYTALDRIIPAHYWDGIWGMRKCTDGSDLPNPRSLRSQALPVADAAFSGVSMYVMNWGQFVSHDLSHVPNYQYPNGKGIECCAANGGVLESHRMHPQCYPIYVDADDAMYGRFQRQCLSMTRAVIAPKEDCTLGYADQMNQVTHWMDLSSVYGSTEKAARDLRSYKGGMLKSIYIYGEESTPVDPEHEDCPNATRSYCFKAGDIRNNQQPGLVVMHTLMLRFHNKVAKLFAVLNPHWDDEILYQETRRLVIAVYQHITYNEYLPLLLGYNFMRGHGFLPLTSGHSDDYDDEEQPMILNEFAAASYRMGHSLVWGKLKIISVHGKEERELNLRHLFNNPKIFHYPGMFDKVIRGYLTHEIRMYDRHFDEEISNHLFQGEGEFGLDLPTINIHRGRDHGLPGYNYFREMCNLTRAYAFEDFLDVIQPDDVQRLKSMYKSVDDVDLFVGGSLEKIFPDSLLGQTFWCIVGYQFQKTKVSDRFFYDLGGQPHSFSQSQLDEIRKMTLSRLICETSGVSAMQPMAFRGLHSKANQMVSCNDKELIADMNLLPWKEDRKHTHVAEHRPALYSPQSQTKYYQHHQNYQQHTRPPYSHAYTRRY